MKKFVSVLLSTALCAMLCVSAWGIVPAATGDTSNIPLMIVVAAVVIIAIVAVLILMNRKK